MSTPGENKVAAMAKWLFAANGSGLSNIAQLLIDSHPTPPVAATISATDGTITAYRTPTDPQPATPWTPGPHAHTHTHPFEGFPHASTAHHYVAVGITSHEEILIIKLDAITDLAIDATDPTPIARSWITQLLTRTRQSHLEVTDPDLHAGTAPRFRLRKPPMTPSDTTTVAITTNTYDYSPTEPAPPATRIVTKPAGDPDNILLCEDQVATLYLEGRYWPLWRRFELDASAWNTFTAPLQQQPAPPAPATAAATPAMPTAAVPAMPTPAPATEPVAAELEPAAETTTAAEPSVAAPAMPTVATEPTPAAPTATTPEPATAPTADAAQTPPWDIDDTPGPTRVEPTPVTVPVAAAQAPSSTTGAHPRYDDSDLNPTGPNEPPLPPTDHRTDEINRPGIYILGPPFIAGIKSDGTHITTDALTTRRVLRKPVKALLMIATSDGHLTDHITVDKWEEHLELKNSNARRQTRKAIRELIGTEIVRQDIDSIELYLDPNSDTYCDWKHVDELVGLNPAAATTETLTAAARLIRGAPFAGIPTHELDWRSGILLNDRLTDYLADILLELGTRQLTSGDPITAHQTAQRGIAINPTREDLWDLAVQTVPTHKRPALALDLGEAIPSPQNHSLRTFLTR